MRIGIFGAGNAGGAASIDAFVDTVGQVAADGFATYWLPQIVGADALTLLAVAGRQVEGIEFGTAVVPIYPQHPIAMASKVLTAQAAVGGRLTLGIGLSHKMVVEEFWGYSFERPAQHMREYLEVLRPLLDGETVAFTGDTVKAVTMGPIAVPGASPCPVLLAALGPKMLELAATAGDGTVTWMTGPQTLASHTVPTLTAAAEAAARPAPRVVASLPVCVTDDAAAARERAATSFAVYGQLPSYRAMLDREGAEGPADVAIVGNERAVRAGIERLADAGATDFAAAEFGSRDDRPRTRDLLRSLL